MGFLCLLGRAEGLGCPYTLGRVRNIHPKPWQPCVLHSPSQEEGDVDKRGEVCEELEDDNLHSKVVLLLGGGPWFL